MIFYVNMHLSAKDKLSLYNSEECRFCLVGFEEMTGAGGGARLPTDRITLQCIRVMRAPAHFQSYYEPVSGGQSGGY